MPWSLFAYAIATYNCSHLLVLPEITCHDHSFIACLCHICCIWVLFFTHIPFVVNCTFNAKPMERLQQRPLLFTMNRTNRMFVLWRLHPAHPGHSTILLRSESLSCKCAKLHTMAASNNRDYMPWSLFAYAMFNHSHR